MNLKVKNALISVSNKDNLILLLKTLKKFDVNIISSGGTYSSIKTAVLYEYKKIQKTSDAHKADLAASFQAAVAEILLHKVRMAMVETNLNELVIGGGVASNKYIRDILIRGLDDKKIYFPPISRCTDNGAMIAYAGSFYLKDVEKDLTLNIKPRWPLSDLNDG